MAASQSGEAREPGRGAGRRASSQVDRRCARSTSRSRPSSRPTLRRRIAAALAPLSESLSLALSAQLKAEVAIELGEITQNTWAAAQAGLAADAVAVGVQADTPPHGMLLSVELALVLQALECLLGGKAAQAPRRAPPDARSTGRWRAACSTRSSASSLRPGPSWAAGR